MKKTSSLRCGLALLLALSASGCTSDSGSRGLSDAFKSQNALPLSRDSIELSVQKLRDLQAQVGGSQKVRSWVEDALHVNRSKQLQEVLLEVAESLPTDDPTVNAGRNTIEESTYRLVVGATYNGLLNLEKEELSKGRADLPMSESTRQLVQELFPKESWGHDSSDNLEQVFSTLLPNSQRESVSGPSPESVETVWFERNIRAMEWGLRSRTVS
jgi:hypothetical protein